MRNLGRLGFAGLVLAVHVACGKSEEQKAAEKAADEAKQAAAAATKAAESAGATAAQGIQAFAKPLENAAAGKGPDGKAIEPIAFESLMTVLPEVKGWQRQQPGGERITIPVPFSQAEANYRSGDAQVEVKIVDSAFSEILVAPWAMFLTAGYQKKTANGYEKSVTVAGSPGFEKWDAASKDGELNLVVNKRFLLTVNGSDITDTKVLHDFAARIDTGKLAALK